MLFTCISCANCVRAVAPTLNELAGADHWQVNTDSPAKALAVHSGTLSPRQVGAAVQAEGFEIEEA